MKISPNTLRQYLGTRPTGDIGPYTCYTTRKNRTIIFPRTYPQKPPSQLQIAARTRFANAAALWQMNPAALQAAWKEAARQLTLSITAYNLWIGQALAPDQSLLATIFHHTGINLAQIGPT